MEKLLDCKIVYAEESSAPWGNRYEMRIRKNNIRSKVFAFFFFLTSLLLDRNEDVV